MLEVIKHFFSTKDFVFVVATDTEQLQNSINAVYGEKFESEAYLRRFFDRKSVLSPPDVDKFLGHYEFDHHENVQLYPDNSHFDRDPIEIVNFKMLARAYSLGLRDIDQLVAKYKACIRSIASNREQTHLVNIFTFLVALIEFDRRPDKFENREILAQGGTYVSFEKLLEQSDIISLHCPLNPETKHIINKESFKLMKDGMMLINTSRGPLINTVDTIEALKSGKLGYLGIDVYEQEEQLFFKDLSESVIKDDVIARLISFPNVLITAHQGFLTKEALQQIAEVTIQNIKDYKAGSETQNQLKL